MFSALSMYDLYNVAACSSRQQCVAYAIDSVCRGTLARQVGEWQPHLYEHDMLRLLHLLRDVAFGLKLLKSQHIVHADLVSCKPCNGRP